MDKIFINGKVYSLDSRNRQYEAIGIEEGKIVFLGSSEEAKRKGAKELVDLRGKTVLPGFIDSHLHLMNYAFINQTYTMFNAYSIGEILERGEEIRKQLEAKNDTSTWIYGRGWNEENFSDEKRPLTKYDLDKISTERPILFIRVCGHMAAVNSKALEIVLSLPNVNEYMRQIDMEKGILTEASVKLCYNAMSEPSAEDLKDMILFAQKQLHANGITSIQTDDFLSLPGRNGKKISEAYRSLDAENKLTLKVRQQPSFTAFEDMKCYIDEGHRTGDRYGHYSIGPVKLYQDGSLGARTALMNTPYKNDGKNCGVAVHRAEDLQNCVDYAYHSDMQIIVHAIGDRAGDMVCTSYENAIAKYGKKNLRLIINHLQFTSEDLFDRMKAADILAFIQPVFVAGDKKMIGTLVDDEVVKRSYTWKTMMEKGLICCSSSDSPVERFNVLEGIQIAVTRDALDEKTDGWNPKEKLTVEEALRTFTINNAYASFEEDVKGSLELNKAADFVILDRDIFETDAHEISKIRICSTIADGREVYSG